MFSIKPNPTDQNDSEDQIDQDYLRVLDLVLDEWESESDEEAFKDL